MLAVSQHTVTKHGNMSDQEQVRVPSPCTEGNVIKLVEVLDCGRDVMCVRFNPDSSLIAVGLSDGSIKVFSLDLGQCLYCLIDQDIMGKHLPVTSVRFMPAPPDDPKIEHHHVLMATYASGFVKFWHYPSQSCLHTTDEGRQTLASAVSPIMLTYLTAGSDPNINIYDFETRKHLRLCQPSDGRDVMNGHRARVFAAQYHPLEPHQFVSGGWDDTVQFWDDRVKHAVRKIYGPHICGDALDIDGTHNHLLTGSWRKDDVLQIWDYRTGEKIKDVPQDHMHGSLLYCAQWLGKDYIVCGGCEHNLARVIDRGTLNTVGQLVDLPSGVYCIDQERFPHPARSQRVAVGSAKNVYIVKVDRRQ